MSGAQEAAALVAGALARRTPDARGRFLRELLAHTAAGLVVIEGEAVASEAVYRLADAVVARGARPQGDCAVRDPARIARDRLLRAERQARAHAEAQGVAQGVAETVALSRARGAAIAGPKPNARRPQPYKRQSGLEWLAGKGRIDAAAKAAGERYGWAYRRARADQPIPSTLDVKPGRGPRPEAPIEDLLAHGEGTALARRKLSEFRQRLSRQPDLVSACDLICGEERTPREAAAGDRDAGRIEAVLKVALDILAARP